MRSGVCTFTVILLSASALPAEDQPLKFELTFDKSVTNEPFTGRVFVMLSRSTTREPRSGLRWFQPEPTFALDTKNWKAGDPLVIDQTAISYPIKMKNLQAREWTIQALMDLDQGHRQFSNAPGNGYSKTVRQKLDPKSSGTVRLVIDQIVEPRKFKESERVKLVDLESRLLSKFHGRSVRMQAGVILPKSWKENPGKKYPIIYNVPGFGGNHHSASGYAARNVTDVAGTEFLYVILNPDCRWGHHVFADSANNGPWGKALTEELIPFIEKKYHAMGKPEARFVTGHSSGGWSSLWLQVAYPDFFGGCWSTAPDPVDFRDFQLVNVYQPNNNIFFDKDGELRPLARRGDQVMLRYKPFSDMEDMMGHGGQLGSFEAVFGPRGKDGRPVQLWDRKTGKIDVNVAKTWEKYDIRLVLERNWKTLGPKLAGKIHVYMGGMDTFYLDGATRLLKKSLRDLGSDAVVEIFPKRNHGNLVDAKLRERIAKEMVAQLNKGTKSTE